MKAARRAQDEADIKSHVRPTTRLGLPYSTLGAPCSSHSHSSSHRSVPQRVQQRRLWRPHQIQRRVAQTQLARRKMTACLCKEAQATSKVPRMATGPSGAPQVVGFGHCPAGGVYSFSMYAVR